MLAVSAVVAIPASVMAAKPLWFMLGFEVVVLVAAAFGVLLAVGRFASGPGLGLLCVCGAIGLAGLLEDQTSRLSNPLAGPMVHKLQIGDLSWDITLYFALRASAALALGLCAAGVVLRRRPRESMRALAVGLLLGAALLVVLGVARMVMHAGLGAFANALAGFAFATAAIGLLAASAHFTIRAFQAGQPDASGPGAGA